MAIEMEHKLCQVLAQDSLAADLVSLSYIDIHVGPNKSDKEEE